MSNHWSYQCTLIKISCVWTVPNKKKLNNRICSFGSSKIFVYLDISLRFWKTFWLLFYYNLLLVVISLLQQSIYNLTLMYILCIYLF